jgi:hypothetical protein
VVHHLRATQILAADHLEAELLQRPADGTRVIDRFGELLVCGKIGVAVIADDKGNPVLRMQR